MSTQHQFSVEHAKQYGLREAVLIHNLHFWVSHNHANNKHEHDGRTWTYNSVHAFEALFTYLTYKQIRTSLETLISLDVLVRGYYSSNPADRSSWYAFTDEFLIANPLPEQAAAPKNKSRPSAPQGKCPSALQGTPSALQGKSLIDQIVNTDVKTITAAPSAPPAGSAKPSKAGKLTTPKESELQEACRATWSAYSASYEQRYGAAPLRNVQASSKLKQFVLRIGQQDSPDVARFFVDRISDPFVLRSYHGVGLLLQNAEAYHTQWVTNRTHIEPATAYQARQDSRDNFFATMTTQGRKNANLHKFDDSNTFEGESQFIGAYPDGEADPMGCPGF